MTIHFLLSVTNYFCCFSSIDTKIILFFKRMSTRKYRAYIFHFVWSLQIEQKVNEKSILAFELKLFMSKITNRVNWKGNWSSRERGFESCTTMSSHHSSTKWRTKNWRNCQKLINNRQTFLSKQICIDISLKLMN